MLKKINFQKLLIFFTLIYSSIARDFEDIEILGIEPNSGLLSGETRVQVRIKDFDTTLIDDFPHPKCRFGSKDMTVKATYVKCSPYPRRVGEDEPTTLQKVKKFLNLF